MMTVVVYTEIQAFASHAWEVLADFGAIDQWSRVVRTCDLTPTEGDAIGDQRTCRLFNGITVRETITAWEDNRGITYVVEGLPLLAAVVVNWHLEPIASITRVTVTIHAQSAGLAFMASPATKQIMKRQYQSLVWDFKRHVEGPRR